MFRQAKLDARCLVLCSLFMKRVLDLTLDSCAAVFLAVRIFIAATLVRLKSSGPARYWSDRVGKGATDLVSDIEMGQCAIPVARVRAMKKTSFSQVEFERKKRLTRRELFLAEMEKIMPWSELLSVVEPLYPKGARGRSPIGLERMLRVYFVQKWNGPWLEGVADAIVDGQALRALVGIELRREAAPNPITVLRFRHRLGLWLSMCGDRFFLPGGVVTA